MLVAGLLVAGLLVAAGVEVQADAAINATPASTLRFLSLM